jgi:predicted NBD/HSP70 family sugar kinase
LHVGAGMNVLMIDIGGTNVKVMVSDREEMRKFPSGPSLTADEMVAGVKSTTADWDFGAVTIGVPGLVEDGQIVREPLNLGGGWLDANLERAFDRPVRIINDAALQAHASYEGGRMLFVGFGTSIGSALVADDTIVPVELGMIPFTKRATFKTRLTKEARKKSGHKRWQKYVHESVALLQDIFWPSTR